MPGQGASEALKRLPYAVQGRIKSLSHSVDRYLSRALPDKNLAPQKLHAAMHYSVFSGGKRYRPLLALGASEAVGGLARNALRVGCAVEFIHAYSLVHDDLPAMDNADERRGKPSCHRQYDEATAILVGDALLTLSFDVLSRSTNPNALKILRRLSAAGGTQGLIGGQVLDLEAMQATGPQRKSETALRAIAQWKTGALITASVVCGGLAGGAGPEAVRRLESFGTDIGKAFQCIDDVHDEDGLVSAAGVETVRREARQLIDRAIESVSEFGEHASLLKSLAQWLGATL